MFGTMGFSELIIILVIVLIIFGAGKLPQIGEGLGKALKGFKKEVHEIPPPLDPNASAEADVAPAAQSPGGSTSGSATQSVGEAGPAPATSQPTAPYTPGPELTPGTTAAMMYAAGPQTYKPPQPKSAPQSPGHGAESQPSQSPNQSQSSTQAQPPTMEERMADPAPTARAAYPALPPNATARPGAKRPSAVVNKAAVARVQERQNAIRQATTQQQAGGVTSKDMQSLGEGLGDALRTFRQAAADVRGTIEPEVRNLRAEMDSAQKEIEQTVETAKSLPRVEDDPPPST